MNADSKKSIKQFRTISFGISLILLAASFIVRRFYKTEYYTFEAGKIIEHSFRNIFGAIAISAFFFVVIFCIISTVISIKSKKEEGRKDIRNTTTIWLIGISCSAIIFLSCIICQVQLSNNQFEPKCYEFTNGKHTIVIEEKSFLLGTWGTIYQLKDSNKAVIIGEIGTDDGLRNNGNYNIKWFDDYAEITYNFTDNSKNTKKIEFK